MADVMAVLERARCYELEVAAQLDHIERLHRIAARARESSAYSESILEKLSVLEREINAHIDRTVDAKLQALEYISVLSGEERGVIERYFILAMTWEQIADKMYMSDRRVYLLRKSALDKLKDRFGASFDRRNYGNRKKNKDVEGACLHNTGAAGCENRCDALCGR
ncbi:MAG: hypothetical protein IJZ95_06380 [Oscillospiraceae bacterium]|nr:hypothetical protein [Oscillospiraceae bacterium]